MLIFQLYIFFDKESFKVSGSFFNQVVFSLLTFKSYLYILNDSLLSDVSFVNILSQSVACLFILLTVSFTQQLAKFLITSLP